jgi:regulator of RNase E activity RraA
MVGPGDVIVVDGGCDESRALVGEIMKNIAQWRGAEGYVIDGAIARRRLPPAISRALHVR